MSGIKFECSGCGETFGTKNEAVKCCGEETVYIVSDCCEEEIGAQTKTDYPLGGTTWGIDYEVPCCIKCGAEIDSITLSDAKEEIK